MAKGFGTAREAFAEIEARKNASGGGGFFFKVEDGESQVVRFIDKEPDWAWVHDLPKVEGESYKTEVCRDQDPETGARTGEACPGCDAQLESGGKEYRRKMQGVVRLIWRNAPLYETTKDDNGNDRKNYDKVVGNEDQVAKWTVGKVVLEELDGKAATYKDLTSRDFVVSRKGIKLNTNYFIEPLTDENGDQVKAPLSDKDKELIEGAPEVNLKAPDYAEWGKKKSKKGSSAPASVDAMPFRQRVGASA